MPYMLRVITDIRRDERGQVIVPAGVMAFFLFLMLVYAVNMGGMIQRRIQAQNAVDSGAMAAALWQARGVNTIQMLNNLHYNANRGLGYLTGVLYGSCIATVAFDLCTWSPWPPGASKVCGGLRKISCPVCKALPWADNAQYIIAKAIDSIQIVVKNSFPIIAFLRANHYATLNNADDVSEILKSVVNLKLDFIPSAWIDNLPKTGIRIVPINPHGSNPFDIDVLSLGVELQSSDQFPWKFDLPWIEQIRLLLKLGPLPIYGSPCQFSDPRPEANKWGWADSYYCGNPGAVTWIAGVKQMPDLLGIGNLPWFTALHEGSWAPVDDYVGNYDEATGLWSGGPQLWNESSVPLSNDHPVRWPAGLVVATSQVDGDPVQPKGLANAYPRLVPVKWLGIEGNLLDGIALPTDVYH